jgi:hypothetical protein
MNPKMNLIMNDEAHHKRHYLHGTMHADTQSIIILDPDNYYKYGVILTPDPWINVKPETDDSSKYITTK